MKRIVALFKQGLKDSEFDNLLLLTRCFLLMMIPYSIFLGFIFFFDHAYPYSVLSFLSTVVFFSGFFASYKTDPRQIAFFIAIYVDVYAVICAVSFGAAASFQNLLLLSLFVFWYDISRSFPRKVIWSALSLIALCYIRAVEKTDSIYFFRRSVTYQTITYTNSVMLIVGLSVIAWFFYTQFAEAERQLFLSNRELRKISHTDPLTKLMNRRFAEEEFEILEANYAGKGDLISVAIGDIDFFKRVNDSYGHDAGDYVLVTLSAMFDKFMQDKGFVVRWGGEEFLFVFEHSNGDDAYVELENLRKQIEHAELSYKEQKIPITMTFGVEEYGSILGMDAAIKDADNKLYLGKSSGRNKVVY